MANGKICPSCKKVNSAIALACECGTVLGGAGDVPASPLSLPKPPALPKPTFAKYRLDCPLSYRDFRWPAGIGLALVVLTGSVNTKLDFWFAFYFFFYVLVTIIKKIEVHSVD